MASLIASAPWKYDVFLSSSSQDAGNFSYLLHKALKDEGILTLRDSQEVEGAESTASLEVGIRQSKVAIVIISPDYASSPRLLEQLVQFLEANRDSSSLIFPGFHLVDPSDVRKQKGTIGASFAKHEQEQDSDKENIIEQSVDEVSTNTSVEEKIIEQPVDEVSRNTSVKDKIITVKHEEQKATVDATSSAEWNFLLFTLILEILSAGFDQASLPSKPHYALIAMLLAAAAVFNCIWELIQKKNLVLKSWKKLHCISYPHLSDTSFESHLDTYGLVSSIYQCVFSTVEYIYFFYNANSPIRLCALPAVYLMCLAGSRLWKKYHKSKPLPV
ncbi:hypothetical protein ACLB2K_009676 [Fragaria x ananassa]